MSGFINYLIIYYSKYFKGSIYVNYSISGCAEMVSFIYVRVLLRKRTVKEFLRFLISWIVILTMILIFFEESGFIPDNILVVVMAVMVFLIRLQVVSVSNYGYHINTQVFPILTRGKAYGITNFVSRPFAAMAPIVTEYSDKPLIFILVFSFISLFTINFIEVLDSEQKSTEKSDKAKPEEEEPSKNLKIAIRNSTNTNF